MTWAVSLPPTPAIKAVETIQNLSLENQDATNENIEQFQAAKDAAFALLHTNALGSAPLVSGSFSGHSHQGHNIPEDSGESVSVFLRSYSVPGVA